MDPLLACQIWILCNSIRTISSKVLKKIPSSVIYIWSSVLGSAHPSICMKRHMGRGIGLYTARCYKYTVHHLDLTTDRHSSKNTKAIHLFAHICNFLSSNSQAAHQIIPLSNYVSCHTALYNSESLVCSCHLRHQPTG